jgi:thiol-disulfide isomerase/thioredoxin
MLLELSLRPLIAFLPLMLLPVIAACDRQSDDAPQAAANASSANGSAEAPASGGREFTGTLDISKRGTPAPTDAFTAPDGKTVTLADFKGKPVLVNLWATWCGPCVAEMPTLDTLAERAGDRMTVLTVSQDSKGPEVVKDFFAQRTFKHLQPYLDQESGLGFAFATGMLPTTVLFDAEGKEVWRVVGGMNWDGPRANTLLVDVLDKKAG